MGRNQMGIMPNSLMINDPALSLHSQPGIRHLDIGDPYRPKVRPGGHRERRLEQTRKCWDSGLSGVTRRWGRCKRN